MSFFFGEWGFFCELIVDLVNLILIRKYGFKIIVCVLCVYVLKNDFILKGIYCVCLICIW